ncbi:MAG: pyruvate formate-lyase-activating protein [Bacillales bacterium]
MGQLIGKIHSLESFGTVDGPGIRFVVFMQGCPLRCLFCHNPDTWEINAKCINKTSDELLKEILKYRSYIKKGGVTMSGGEPLLQIDFIIELFKKLKENNIHTCIDTSGITFNKNNTAKMDELLKYTDLILLDLKTIREDAHIKLTNSSNKQILEFARYLDKKNKPVWIRHVLLNNYETDEELKELREFIETLKNVEKIEILPYHTMGIVKYESLNIPYPLKDMEPPDKKQIEHAKKILMKGV